jgi:hypothetical protein
MSNLEIPQGLTVKKDNRGGSLLDSENQSPVKTLEGSFQPLPVSYSVLLPRKHKDAIKPLTTYNYDEKMFDRNLAGLQKSNTADFRNSKYGFPQKLKNLGQPRFSRRPW